MGRLKPIVVIASTICTLTAVLALGASFTQAQADRLVWSQVTGEGSSAVDYNSVFMVDDSNTWIAGRAGGEGTLVKFELRSGVWKQASNQTFRAPLNSVVATPDKTVWAAGDNGLIIRAETDGTKVLKWQEMPVPQTRANLATIQMLGNGEEGWAGGVLPPVDGAEPQQPVLWHFRDGVWLQEGSISGQGGIFSLHLGPAGGWAVGSSQLGAWNFSKGGWSMNGRPPNCGPNFGEHCSGDFYGVRTLSGDEAWAVGYRRIPCSQCRNQMTISHFAGGRWEWIDEADGARITFPRGSFSTVLNGVYFADNGNGLAVGMYGRSPVEGQDVHPLVMSYRDGKWRPESLPDVAGQLNAVSMTDATHALAVGTGGLLFSYGYGQQPQALPTPTVQPGPTQVPGSPPTDRVADPKQQGVIYYPVVGHTLRGAFRRYWQQHGGLPQFGYPVTEEYTEVSPTDNRPYTVQYFERALFEHHPENRPPYDVLLGLLGHTVTAQRKGESPFMPATAQATPGGVYFPETGHNLHPQFVEYWRAHGGLPVYGYPISEPFQEISPSDRKTYLVQYFERNRFEYHPELPEPFRVSLGLLGVQVLRERGWIP